MSLTVDVQLPSDPDAKQSLAICSSAYKVVINNMNNNAIVQH